MDRKTDSQSFDRIATLYNTARPSYPRELVEDILQYSGIQPGGQILEIGSGTGKATQLFAHRGYNILCLEPGQNLIEVAAQNFAADPQVRFVQARFEAWETTPEQFDLIICAQAFHWIPESARYQKTAEVLKAGGTLALFWNMYPGTLGPVREELDQVYQQFAPEIAKAPLPPEQIIAGWTNKLLESPYYENVVAKQYPIWIERYDTQAYLRLLNTYSDHLRLPDENRKLLFEKIGAVIDRHGGFIDRPYLPAVYLAKKKAG